MRIKWAALAGAIMLTAFTGAAMAQPAPASPPAPRASTPEEIARARAYADTMIAQGNAAAWFENASEGALPVARHRATGLECAFSPGGQRNGLSAVLAGSTFAPGDYMVCYNDDPQLHIQTVLTAMRFNGASSLDDQMGMAVQAQRRAHSDLTPWRGSAVEIEMSPQGPGLPEIRTARFTYSDGGQRRYLRMSVSIVGRWVIGLSTTGPADEDVGRMATELAAGLSMNMHVMQVRDHLAGSADAQPAPAAPSTAPPPAVPPPSAQGAQPGSVEQAARDYADRLIERAGAGQLMVNVTDATLPSVRHTRSGMVCRFAGSASDQISIYTAYSARPGDDIGCNTALTSRRFVITLYATRYTSGTLDEHFRRARGEMSGRYSRTRPWTGQATQTEIPEGVAQGRDLRLLVTEQGAEEYTRMSMVEVAGWTVLLRFTGPQDAAAAGDEMASRILGLAVQEVAAAARPAQ